MVALGLQGLDLLLPCKLFLQGQCGRGSPAGLLDLAIQLLDFPLQPDFQIIGPAVELVRFGLEESGIALGDSFLDDGLPLPRFCVQSWPASLPRPLPVRGGNVARQAQESGGGLFIQHRTLVGDGGNNQVIFRLIEGFDGKDRGSQPAGLAEEGFQDGNLAVVLAIVEMDFGRWQLPVLGLGQQRLGQGMIEAVQVRLAGAARQFIETKGDAGLPSPERDGASGGRSSHPGNSAWPFSSCRVSCMSSRSKRLR